MFRRVLPLVVLTLIIASPASAQGTFEIHGFGGFRSGGGFAIDSDLINHLRIEEGPAYGFSIGIGVTENWQGEILLSRVTSDVRGTRTQGGDVVGLGDVDSDQVLGNVLYQLGEGTFRPFFFGGAGITRFGPAELDHEIRFAWNAGTGVKVFLTEHIGLRFQGRVTGNRMSAVAELHCDESSRICLTDDTSSWMYLVEGTGGIIFTFGGGGNGSQ